MEGDRRAKVRELAREESWEAAKSLLEQTPNDQRDVEWTALAAEIEAGLGEIDRALELYQRVLETRPRHPAALYNRALVFVDAERFEDAVSDLEDLVEVEGESVDTLALLAEAYLGAEFLVPAWLCARRWAEIAEDEAGEWSAITTEARALAEMGRVEAAQTVIDEALADLAEPSPEREEALAFRASLAR